MLVCHLRLIWSNWRAFAVILIHFSYLQDLLIDCILQQHIHRDLWHANNIKRRSDRCSGRNSTLWLAACSHVLFYFLTLLWESDFLITACPDLWHKTSSSWNTHWRSAALNCLGFSSSLGQSKLTNCRSETKLRHLMLDHVEMTAAHTHSGTFFRVDSRSVSKNCFVLLPSMLSSNTIFCYFGKLPTLRISSATEQRLFCGLACSIYRGWKEVSALRLLLCLSESIVLNLTFKRGIGDLVTSLFVRASVPVRNSCSHKPMTVFCLQIIKGSGWVGVGEIASSCVCPCVRVRSHVCTHQKMNCWPRGSCVSLSASRTEMISHQRAPTHTHTQTLSSSIVDHPSLLHSLYIHLCISLLHLSASYFLSPLPLCLCLSLPFLHSVSVSHWQPLSGGIHSFILWFYCITSASGSTQICPPQHLCFGESSICLPASWMLDWDIIVLAEEEKEKKNEQKIVII